VKGSTALLLVGFGCGVLASGVLVSFWLFGTMPVGMIWLACLFIPPASLGVYGWRTFRALERREP
jgi:cytochrome c biogenesis factor